MTKTDKTVSLLVLGTLTPVCFLLLFWWGSIPFVEERLVPVMALLGLLAGAALDCTLLRRFVFRLFSLPVPALAALGACYSVLVYGFFMGFPVFNSLVGIAGGTIAARACVLQGLTEEETNKRLREINLFFLGLLFVLCVCSAILALNEPTIGLQIKGMFSLPFDVTFGMVWALILLGGALLLVFQYFCASRIARCVLKKAGRRP